MAALMVMEAKFTPIISGVTKLKTPDPPRQVRIGDQAAVRETKSGTVRAVDGTTAAAAADGSRITLDELVGNLNQQIQMTTRALRFSIDERYGRPIITVVDKETDVVIRQIPPAVALQIADALDAMEDPTGALISERA